MFEVLAHEKRPAGIIQKALKGSDIMVYLTKNKDFSYYFPYMLRQHNQLLYIGEINGDDKILLSDGRHAYRHKTYMNKKGLYVIYKGKRFYITLYDDSKRLINFIGEPIDQSYEE